MRNKNLALAVVATVAVVGAWNFGHSTNEMALSDVALANVEALASGETGTTVSCDAGGLGASSCTISATYPGGSGSSKSVTCISGYYACCKKSSWGDLSASCVSY